MRNNSPDERADELQRAKSSNREWISTGRTWDYHLLSAILPDRHSLVSMVKELLRRGFFIRNQPDDSELVLDPGHATTTAKTPNTKDFQKILKEAKADFLWIYGKLLKDSEVTNVEKTLYRYYCEAILIFRHHQCPGAVEGLTVSSSILASWHSLYAVIV